MGNLTFYLKHINIEYEKIGAKKMITVRTKIDEASQKILTKKNSSRFSYFYDYWNCWFIDLYYIIY